MRTSSGTPTIAEHLVQHRDHDGAAADPEQPGEQPGDDPGGNDRGREPEQIADRSRHCRSRLASRFPPPGRRAALRSAGRECLASAALRSQHGESEMAVVETEEHGQVLVVRMNRPERLNALNAELRTALAETWTEFRHDDRFEVAIFTGTGRGFCAGEDMKESSAARRPRRRAARRSRTRS